MQWILTFNRSKAGTSQPQQTPTLQNQDFLVKVNIPSFSLIISSNDDKAMMRKFFKSQNLKNIWLITRVKNRCIIRTAMINISLHLKSRPLGFRTNSTNMFCQTLSNKTKVKAKIKRNSSTNHRSTLQTRSLQSMLIITLRWVAAEEGWATLGPRLVGARIWGLHHHLWDLVENSWNWPKSKHRCKT